MRCSRCGRNNPDNINRCLYCNTPLKAHLNNKRYINNKPSNSGNSSDKIIIAVIIALAVALAALAGIYLFQSTHSNKHGFRSGGGGGSVSVNQNTRPSQLPTEITLDGEDPDVEIYSFNTDVYDILVGNSSEVTFTAEIFANIEIHDSDVVVVNEAGVSIGYMNDNGIDGDSEANDGIYTLKTNLSSDIVKNVMYYARVKSITSEGINLCFYKEFTDEELDQYDYVINTINEATAEYIDTEGYLIEGKYTEAKNALIAKLHELKSSGIVSQYKVNGYSFSIKLQSGIPFVYEFLASDTDSGIGRGTISAYQPFKNTYSQQNINAQSDDATDGSARNIANKFRSYSFGDSSNFDLDEVTLENLKNISSYSIVIWHGHGGWNLYENEGSSLAIGEKQQRQTTKNYSADITSHRIIQCTAANRSVYAITGGFVQKYVSDMTGAMLYLAACESGKDMISGTYKYNLAQSFINKGALAVVGNSETILTDYNTKMERDVFSRLTEPNSDGNYFNLSEALSWAKQQNGNYCCEEYKAETIIFPRNNEIANSYQLIGTYGYVAGTVKSADTSAAMKDALVRVYSNNTVIQKTRTDDTGYYNMQLPVGDYIIKITKGHYKTAKIAVSITENNTTYNETFLMLGVGINTGYANGTITNAITGQTVPGVSINMRKSWNNKSGSIVKTTVTNENGYYEISHIPGFYTIEYSKEGYITGYKNIIIGIVDYEAQNAVISPELPDDGEYRIVLSWSNTPKDLDSHLTGPSLDGGRFHLYYRYANTSNNNNNMEYYQLDLDNTDIVSRPSIPETTTIVTQLDGVYRYSVHDYSNRGNANSDAMALSNATVNVYKGSVLVATYHVPPNMRGTIWTVFEITGNQITPINRIGNGYEDNISLF